MVDNKLTNEYAFKKKINLKTGVVTDCKGKAVFPDWLLQLKAEEPDDLDLEYYFYISHLDGDYVAIRHSKEESNKYSIIRVADSTKVITIHDCCFFKEAITSWPYHDSE